MRRVRKYGCKNLKQDYPEFFLHSKEELDKAFHELALAFSEFEDLCQWLTGEKRPRPSYSPEPFLKCWHGVKVLRDLDLETSLGYMQGMVYSLLNIKSFAKHHARHPKDCVCDFARKLISCLIFEKRMSEKYESYKSIIDLYDIASKIKKFMKDAKGYQLYFNHKENRRFYAYSVFSSQHYQGKKFVLTLNRKEPCIKFYSSYNDGVACLFMPNAPYKWRKIISV